MPHLREALLLVRKAELILLCPLTLQKRPPLVRGPHSFIWLRRVRVGTTASNRLIGRQVGGTAHVFPLLARVRVGTDGPFSLMDCVRVGTAHAFPLLARVRVGTDGPFPLMDDGKVGTGESFPLLRRCRGGVGDEKERAGGPMLRWKALSGCFGGVFPGPWHDAIICHAIDPRP